jgi:hypothetical protein
MGMRRVKMWNERTFESRKMKVVFEMGRGRGEKKENVWQVRMAVLCQLARANKTANNDESSNE